MGERFVNPTRIVASPKDHLLVIYGFGHIRLLTQFNRYRGLYTMESAETYLSQRKHGLLNMRSGIGSRGAFMRATLSYWRRL